MVAFLYHMMSRIGGAVGLGVSRGSSDGDGYLFQRVDGRIPQIDLAFEDATGLRPGGYELPQEVGKLFPGQVHGLGINDALFPVFERLGGSSIQKTQLFIGPDGDNGLGIDHSNACATTLSLPVLNALDVELGEDLVDGGNEVVHVFGGVPWGDREPQPLLTAGNGGVVDGLDVDSVVGEQRIRSDLGQYRVSD